MYGEDIELSYELLTKENECKLAGFNCGNEELDKYIKTHCASADDMVTRIVIDSEKGKVVCVYSLSASSIIWVSYGKYYYAPAIEIKVFALDEEYQNVRYSCDENDGCLSNILLSGVINQILDITDNCCGANLVSLYSTPSAIQFYKKNDFIEYPEDALHSDDRFLDGCTPLYMRIR